MILICKNNFIIIVFITFSLSFLTFFLLLPRLSLSLSPHRHSYVHVCASIIFLPTCDVTHVRNMCLPSSLPRAGASEINSKAKLVSNFVVDNKTCHFFVACEAQKVFWRKLFEAMIIRQKVFSVIDVVTVTGEFKSINNRTLE